MKRLALAVCVIVSALAAPLWAAEWKPAKGPLFTRWAKDVSPDKVLPEYPRPQLVRKDWQNLNGLWQLAIAKQAEEPPIGKDLAEQILVPFPVESALSGVMKRADRLWYRRTFTVPADWAGRDVMLHFGAVDWETNVWVNGKKVGHHKGGYDPFSFDVTSALKTSGEQELVVGVFDPTDAGTQPRGKQVNRPEGIYYTPTTGIWQTVWLEPVPRANIRQLKITPDVDNSAVDVVVTATQAAPVTVEVREGDKMLASVSGKSGEAIHLKLESPKLWSPESPTLYDLHVKLQQDGKAVDSVQSYFGMRKTSLGRDEQGVNRLYLNGKPYFQVGPLDQGFWPDGLYTAPTDEALRYDIEITKKLGFNMARKHVKVEPQRWYYWCDKLGLIVWQDMPSGDASVAPNQGEIKRTADSAKQYEQELEAMIDTHYNHPSIVMWVVFNEGWGQFDTVRITDWTKRRDPTRLANCASGWNDMPAGDVHDIHVYPGPGAPPREASRAGVLGEFGGLGLGVDGHTWTNQTWGYRGTASSDDLTRKYERLMAGVFELKGAAGLAAAVYTQTTDVETEANGLLTYDREVIKVDLPRVAAVNQGDVSKIPIPVNVVASSQKEPQTWKYTFEKPADDWFKPDFDDKGWRAGPGGFGTAMTPGSVVRTKWDSADIWIRREFTLPDPLPKDLLLSLHHDEDASIYLNGVLSARVSKWSTDYEETPISEEARAALKPGTNSIAVHCHQTGGGQYIDVGIIELKVPKSK